ncbi:MAG: hypothetical protein KatS3mg087_1061 [Patescibacteria group bacterium]|nr:MAG: hypothetical protein KatS3mg087_1061 [Patescibacteria group bacterium]
MALNLEIEVVGVKDVPPWAKLVWFEPRGDQSTHECTCVHCNGAGCSVCDGKGTIKLVKAFRASVPRDKLAEVKAYLNQHAHSGIKKTIRLSEHGGGLTRTGYATIVCDTNGQPFGSVGGSRYSHSEHAIFYVSSALEIYYAQARGIGNGAIRHVYIDEETWEPRCRYVFDFDDDTLNSKNNIHIEDAYGNPIPLPIDAMRAAHKKARCYHCREAHFVKQRKSR